jgi:hypothetical protein
MALFQKSTPLEAAIAARVKLRNRLAESEAAIATATSAANALALDGADDAVLDAAESQVRNRVDRVTTLTAALTESNTQIARLEAERDEVLDHAERSTTVVEFHKKLKEIDAAEKDLLAAIVRMNTVTEWAHLYVPEAAGVKSFLMVAKAQLTNAMAVIGRCLREHAAAILRHDEPAALRTVEVAPVLAVVEVPELRQMFTSHAITWIDHSGSQRILGKWQDVELPISEALFALKAKLVMLPTDERCKKLRGLSPGHPEPSWLNNLTTKIGPDIPVVEGNAGAAVDPIRSSAGPFTVVDRGPAVTVRHREAL